eukprot:923197-Rhodomonas_salina.1
MRFLLRSMSLYCRCASSTYMPSTNLHTCTCARPVSLAVKQRKGGRLAGDYRNQSVEYTGKKMKKWGKGGKKAGKRSTCLSSPIIVGEYPCVSRGLWIQEIASKRFAQH